MTVAEAEAEAALGRAMTSAEAAWFRYSATMPDSWLLWHSGLFFFLLYMVVPLPVLLLEQLAPAVVLPYKLQSRVWLPLATVGRYLRDTAAVVLLVIGPYNVVTYYAAKMAGIRMGLPLPSLGEVMGQLVVYSLLEDYLSYWIHRLLHTKWGYSNIHRVHHELTSPTGYATSYGHWSEIIIFTIPTFAGPAIVPCHVTTYCLWFSVRLLEAIETHCGYDFPFNPVKLIPFYGGAEFHDYHHLVGGKSQSNFGSVFTYCDYIYGTDKGYRYRKALAKQNTMEKGGNEGFISAKHN
ncbi:hypothetical protein ACP4OV_015995 [Aristida adscensionis]